MSNIKKICEGIHFALTPRAKESKGVPRVALNATRGTVLASRLEVAGTGGSRRKGLLGREELPIGEGLWITPCESVHTFFMQFAIDLVYLDRNLLVKKVKRSVAPWRLSACLSAHSVLELPVGTIAATETKTGDRIELISETVEAQDASNPSRGDQKSRSF